MEENKRAPFISLIFPVKNEGNNVLNTIESVLRIKTCYEFEIIVVDDGSIDGCCHFISSHKSVDRIKLLMTEGIGLAKAKNFGAEQSRGDYLIFCDAHLFFEDFWIERVLEPILIGQAHGTTPGIASTNSIHIVGYGQTLDGNLSVKWNKWHANPFPSAILPGGCFCISRKVFLDIGGFDNKFKVWGYEDIEISLKMWLFGYKCYAQPRVRILHLFRNSPPYHLTLQHVYYNLLRMAYLHFSEEKIKKCKKLIKTSDSLEIESLVLAENVIDQREIYFARRKHDDNWFFKEFKIDF
ncbi:glycosyltransferase family 2 protein [Bacillus pseudomycoides]|uniref:glycosyltransferase family 2 protein n=1 Tax=Bacillus pseudomycoides TaxID=64104 RepID=UPI002E2249B2|nr:glycosyltransferase [Bacillus pseudomycoides]